MKASAKDLRFHSKELIDTVLRGEEVIITYRGKPTAKLVPLDGNRIKTAGDNKLFGMWKDNERVADVSEFIGKIRKGRF